jgi:putative ABC transport system permease protein
MPFASLLRVLHRARSIFAPRALNDDMQAEMREHLDRATDRLIARGMSPDEARIAARREFGNLTVLQEEARDARAARWIDALRGDLRFALRYFVRHKATVAIIVVVLTLGTGANAMFFSIFQAEFLRPAPAVPENDAHARIWAVERATTTAKWQPRAFTHAELDALAARRETFATVSGWLVEDVILGGGSIAGDSTPARSVRAQFVTPNFFAALGVPLAAGQGFARVSDAPELTAVMSHEIAEQLYGNSANAMGRQILVNEVPLRVVGVTPPKFQGAMRDIGQTPLWIPLSARTDIARLSPRWLAEDPAVSLFATMAPAASREQATAIARQVVSTTLPDSAARVGMARSAEVSDMLAPPPGEREQMILALTVIMSIGALILLVAWTNVSSLMVAAAVGRRHEIAVRLSLGASRSRLLRQLVTESTLLALTGGAAGLTLAWWTLALISRSNIGVDVTPDMGTFLFVLGLALICGILFGLSPALHATRGGVASAIRDSGTASTSRSRLQRGFVVAQIVLSQPLLVLLGTLLSLELGDYKPLAESMSERVIAAEFRPVQRAAPGQRREAVDSLVPRIAARPEVLSAVLDASAFDVRRIVVPDQARAAQDSAPTIVHLEGAAPGWFAVVDVPIVLGRDVTLADTAVAERAVVIGSDLARKLWGDANPVGRMLASPVIMPGQDSVAMTVVGVYDAARRLPGMSWEGSTSPARTNTPARVFTAHGKQWRHDRVLVRTRGPAASFVPELHRFVREIAPSLPVTGVGTLAQADERMYRETLKEAMLAGAGGAAALLLASLGLYGVVSLAVQQRTREIGIRIAVGAHPTRVARMFLASGVRVSALALAIGLPISVAGLRIAMSQGLVIAPGANPYLIGVGIGALLLAVAAAATWIPARRAALVDPVRTLRQE